MIKSLKNNLFYEFYIINLYNTFLVKEKGRYRCRQVQC